MNREIPASLENENILQLFADRLKLKCDPTESGEQVSDEKWYGKVLDPLWPGEASFRS